MNKPLAKAETAWIRTAIRSIPIAGIALCAIAYAHADEPLVIPMSPGLSETGLEGVPRLHVTDMEDAIITADSMTIEPEERYAWIVEPDESIDMTLTGRDPELGDRAVLTVWDWRNRPIARHGFDIPFTEPVRFEIEGRGVYLLTLDRFDGEQCVSRLVRSVGAVSDNRDKREIWNDGEFFIGTAVFPGRMHWSNEIGPAFLPELGEEGTAELEAELNARLGVQVARLTADEEGISLYDDTGFLLHLKVFARGEIDPAYEDMAGEADVDFRLPRTESAAQADFKEAAQDWADKAFFVQIQNEPDNESFWLGSAEEYVEHYRWGYEAFKREASDLPLSAGGYTGELPDRLEVFVHELKPIMDWVTFHTHGPLLDCIEKYEKIAALHEEAGYTDPVWVNTEMGSRAWRLDQDRQQAIDAVQKTLYFWARGHRGVTIYRSRDILRGPGRVENGCWGYLDYFMAPRFTYGVLSALIDIYAGAEFSSALHLSDTLHLYKFTRDGVQLITAFRPDGSNGEPITLVGDMPAIQQFDAMGNAASLTGEQVEIDAGALPITVEWPSEANVSLE
ncbi:MAG: hypothetical protein ACLFV4_00635 [Candidatus Hydrogenedentota bacterium]